jgi:hypothetical protein
MKKFILERIVPTSETQEWTNAMLDNKTSDLARPPIFHAPTCLSELIRTVSVARPMDVVAVPAGLLVEAFDAQAAPSSPPSPERVWIRPSEALARLPIGATKLNTMMASGEVISKLLGGCRLIYSPSLAAAGDPHARLKRGRPPKSAAAKLVGSAPPPRQSVQARRRGRPRRDADPAE